MTPLRFSAEARQAAKDAMRGPGTAALDDVLDAALASDGERLVGELVARITDEQMEHLTSDMGPRAIAAWRKWLRAALSGDL